MQQTENEINENVISVFWELSQGDKAKVRKQCAIIGKWSDTYQRSFLSRLKQKKSLSENEQTVLATAIKSINLNILEPNTEVCNNLCSKEDVLALNQRYKALKTFQRVELKEICCVEVDNIDDYMEYIRLKKPIPNDILNIISQNIAKHYE